MVLLDVTYRGDLTSVPYTRPPDAWLTVGWAAEGTLPLVEPVANLASALAGALPAVGQDIGVAQGIALEASLVQELVNLGIWAIPVTADELVAFCQTGRWFYDHVAPYPDQASSHRVSTGRIPGDLARDTLQLYRSVFKVRQVDSETGKVTWKSNVPTIRKVLQAAVDAYRQAHDGKFDPLGFWQFVRDDDEYEKARLYLRQLKLLFEKLEMFGLSATELANAKQYIIRPLRLRGVSPAQLQAVIECVSPGK